METPMARALPSSRSLTSSPMTERVRNDILPAQNTWTTSRYSLPLVRKAFSAARRTEPAKYPRMGPVASMKRSRSFMTVSLMMVRRNFLTGLQKM